MNNKWTGERDLMLLGIMRNGGKTKEALVVAAAELEVSISSVTNRWHSETLKLLRGVAKNPAKQKKIKVKKQNIPKLLETIHKSIDLLSPAVIYELSSLKEELSALKLESSKIKEENKDLKNRYSNLSLKYDQMEDDFRVMSKVFNRARDMVSEEEAGKKKRFNLEQNGNLQVIEI